MNNKKLEKVIPNLKVGNGCMLMNVSGILEYENYLSYSLTYSTFDFLYDFDHLTTFLNPKRPEEYISKDNELFIVGGIDSLYHEDYEIYTRNHCQQYNLFQGVRVYEGEKRQNLEVEIEYIQKDIPLIFCCDQYYLYEYYKKKNSAMNLDHSSSHSAVLVDIDLDNKQCTIMDKFYDVIVEVPLKAYIEAKTSDHLRRSYFAQVIIQRMDIPENERIRLLLKKNLNQTLEETATIEGRTYMKNLKGLEMLIKDLPKFFKLMSELKGKYAPQFTTKLLSPMILEKVSFKNLMSYVSKTIIELQKINELLNNLSTTWMLVDKLCDKCFLKKHHIVDYTDRFATIFKNIYEMECQVIETLASVEKLL
ncbi:MAG: hypothetical protein KAX49_02965 [Halanaerobiales bacterium]|nr:hypothetical protein [Halanaerobiales bacterium]